MALTTYRNLLGVLLAALLLLAACDGAPMDDPGTDGPGTDDPGTDDPGADGTPLATLFPHDVGQAWAYAYTDSYYAYDLTGGSTTQRRISGTLTWEVLRVDEQAAHVDLEIAEAFEGTRWEHLSYPDAVVSDTTYAAAWEGVLRARIAGDSLTVEGYADGSFPGLHSLRWAPRDGADERVEVDSLVFCMQAGCTRFRYVLERDVGLAELGRSVSWRGGVRGLTLELER